MCFMEKEHVPVISPILNIVFCIGVPYYTVFSHNVTAV